MYHIELLLGWNFPIQLASFMFGSVKVILKIKPHFEIMLILIFSLCVQSENLIGDSLLTMPKHNGDRAWSLKRPIENS